MIYQINSRIVLHREIKPRIFLLKLHSPEIAQQCFPGQFITISIKEVFLRRPFSIFTQQGNSIAVVYKVVGLGTTALSKFKPYDKLNIIGPLGSGFNLPPLGKPILVAGGTGIACLNFLSEKIQNKGIIFYGTKTKKDMIDCNKDGWVVKNSTEDGSSGYRGLVSDYFAAFIRKQHNEKLYIYAAGPKPLLRKVAEICSNYDLPCQVSLEEIITCGVGACRGCVVKLRKQNSESRKQREEFEYKTVCKDGPVFDANEIVW